MRPDPPLGAIDQAYEAIKKARLAKAADYCPDHLLAAEDSLAAARRLLRYESQRLYFLRDYARVLGAATRARIAAVRAETTAIAIEDSLRDESASALAMTEAAVQQARSRLALVPADRANRSALSRLEVAVAEIQHLREQAAYREALARCETTLRGASRLEQVVVTSLREYASSRDRWRRWADETIRRSRESGEAAIIVQKIAHTLDLYVGGKLVKTYRVDLGPSWMGPKLHMGDNVTPEGRYHITRKKGPRETKYHKALLLNYPNEEDQRRFASAKKNGELSHRARIGGLIEVHGHGGRGQDWTQGCVAMANGDMDHLYSRVAVGTPVTIVGTLGVVE
jgi:hypothetical protein